MQKRSQILQTERKTLEGFFCKEFPEVSDLPAWITDELIQYWEDSLFDIHYLPKISLDQSIDLPSWTDRPDQAFYQKIKEGKLQIKAKELSGKWILIDARAKPEKRSPWISATDVKILQKARINPKKHLGKWQKQLHEQEYLKEQLKTRGFGSRFCLSPADIHELKPFVSDYLKIDSKKMIRLPYFIEFNYLGNACYPQWRTTKTWEWFQDQMADGSHLAGGSQSVGIVGWDPVDHWSTILGFRVVIEL